MAASKASCRIGAPYKTRFGAHSNNPVILYYTVSTFMERFRFHPVIAKWFEQKFGSPTEPQEQGWPAIQSGAHTLIAAPTGSGKTLAAFLAALDVLFREGLNEDLKEETRIVYVSPLK